MVSRRFEMMYSTTPNPSPPRVNRLGRSAWLIMGVAFAMSASMIVPAVLFGDKFKNGDGPTVVVVGAVAGGVLILWSVVLAIRALFAGERSLLPILLVNFATLLPAAGGCYGWYLLPSAADRDSIFEIAILCCALIPFLSFACITGTVAIKILLSIVERRRVRHGLPLWSRRRRWRNALALWSVYALLLGFVSIPVATFLVSARIWSDHGSIDFEHGSSFRIAVLKESPKLIRDISESILYASNSRKSLAILLSNDLVSLAKLETRVHDTDLEISRCALDGLVKHRPQLAARHAEEIAENFVPRSAAGAEYVEMLHECVAQYGTSAQKKAELQRVLNGKNVGGSAVFYALSLGDRDESLIPILDAILRSDDNFNYGALIPLFKWLPGDRIISLFQSAVPNLHARRRCISFVLSANHVLATKMFLMLIEHESNVVRLEALERGLPLWCLDPAQKGNCVRRLLELLNEDVVSQRRGAAKCLLTTFDFERQGLKSSSSIQDVFDFGGKSENILPETREETDEFGQIRADAEEWLRTHDSSIVNPPPPH